MQPLDSLRAGDALLLVDVQNDFCPGGALAIENGDRVVPVMNEWLAAAAQAGIPVYASRDWHPLGHPSFDVEGGPWPVHCVQDTPGAAFHPDLRLPEEALVVTKGTRFDQDQYSAFDQTGLHERLQKDGIRRIWTGGLAQDVCVCASALDARKLGYKVALIPGASFPVTRDGGVEALEKMQAAGVEVGSAG